MNALNRRGCPSQELRRSKNSTIKFSKVFLKESKNLLPITLISEKFEKPRVGKIGFALIYRSICLAESKPLDSILTCPQKY